MWDVAELHYDEMRKCASFSGLRFIAGSADYQLSRLCHYADRFEEYLGHLETARRIFSETGQLTRVADVHRQKAEFMLERGMLDEAEAELDAAEELYSQRMWVREAGGVPLLRLELKLRRDPFGLTEADLDAVRTARSDAPWQAGLANALLAIGFAMDNDMRSSRHYARETLAQLQKIDDINFNSRILKLAQELGDLSAAMRDLTSYWADTMALPGVPAKS
jgi:tetratricopeptide (TPR) repeat protein